MGRLRTVTSRNDSLERAQPVGNELYSKIIINDDYEAMRTLFNSDTPAAYILYCVLRNQREGFSMQMRPTWIAETTGLSPAKYKRAFAKLIDMGYLVANPPGQETQYDFYVKPQKVHG